MFHCDPEDDILVKLFSMMRAIELTSLDTSLQNFEMQASFPFPGTSSWWTQTTNLKTPTTTWWKTRTSLERAVGQSVASSPGIYFGRKFKPDLLQWERPPGPAVAAAHPRRLRRRGDGRHQGMGCSVLHQKPYGIIWNYVLFPFSNFVAIDYGSHYKGIIIN